MKSSILLLFLAVVLLGFVGCSGDTKKKKEMLSEAYDKYHPTYGYRNELPDQELELSDEGESMWQRPPERVRVAKTPDGPETGPFQRAPVTQYYLGYKEGDDTLLEREMWNKTGNLTTRDPVAEMPDYLRGDYGSTGK